MQHLSTVTIKIYISVCTKISCHIVSS